MSLNVVALWIKYLSGHSISILWAAIPGIVAFVASVMGLIKLYPRISSSAPWLARGGVGFALLAAASLCIAALWILGEVIIAGGVSEPPPSGILGLIGIFIVAMVIAFIGNAFGFILGGELKSVGYLLMVPVVCWATMLVVGMFKGLQAGLALDVYTNAFIAAAFILLGVRLKNKHGSWLEKNRPKASGVD